jgi:hypothetical protein
MMKEFRILQTCSICSKGFDSDYTLMKHTSISHPKKQVEGWVGGDRGYSSACGDEHHKAYGES